MPTSANDIERLAADGFGAFLPAYRALHGDRHPGIRTDQPDRCIAEAERRGLACVNVYLAGAKTVICWPTVPSVSH